MDQKDRAMRGWLGEPPPERERTPLSHEHKWRKMMGAAESLPNQCDTEEAREAHRRYQEEGTWQASQHVNRQAKQRVAEHERLQERILPPQD